MFGVASLMMFQAIRYIEHPGSKGRPPNCIKNLFKSSWE